VRGREVAKISEDVGETPRAQTRKKDLGPWVSSTTACIPKCLQDRRHVWKMIAERLMCPLVDGI
jgi:hypothetical protein